MIETSLLYISCSYCSIPSRDVELGNSRVRCTLCKIIKLLLDVKLVIVGKIVVTCEYVGIWEIMISWVTCEL